MERLLSWIICTAQVDDAELADGELAQRDLLMSFVQVGPSLLSRLSAACMLIAFALIRFCSGVVTLE
ncbi:hypothetical protein COLO4_16098 [Corchorus olitorius]|uniref:Uncharacterized protein n=1 Tax=Corchorus olitorius TaxID=93759 RepID=A0A1R3JJI6_9ROSI|nr:hypothetical protein COLO4_16098 [Corchorus olitorius]